MEIVRLEFVGKPGWTGSVNQGRDVYRWQLNAAPDSEWCSFFENAAAERATLIPDGGIIIFGADPGQLAEEVSWLRALVESVNDRYETRRKSQLATARAREYLERKKRAQAEIDALD